MSRNCSSSSDSPNPERRQAAENSDISRFRLPSSSPAEVPCAWKRSSTWWMTIPKRWLIVGSWGMPKTRANLYFSGQVR